MFCVSLRLLESREPSHDLVEAGGRGSIEAGGVSGPEEVGGVGRVARSGNFASRLDRQEAVGTVGRHVFLATLGDGTRGWFWMGHVPSVGPMSLAQRWRVRQREAGAQRRTVDLESEQPSGVSGAHGRGRTWFVDAGCNGACVCVWGGGMGSSAAFGEEAVGAGCPGDGV